MDEGGGSAQQQTSAHHIVGPHHRNGCIHQGVGCRLPGDDHRGSLDCCGAMVSYQLPGALCSLPGIEDLSEGREKSEGSPEDGQCDIDCLHQQDGRHPLHCPLRSSSDHLEMVPGEENHNPCRALTRQTECTGRLGVTPCHRFQQLDAPERC